MLGGVKAEVFGTEVLNELNHTHNTKMMMATDEYNRVHELVGMQEWHSDPRVHAGRKLCRRL